MGADGMTLLVQIPLAWGPTPYDGIIFQNSEVSMGMIQDGTSNTFLVGEKYCCPNFYATVTTRPTLKPTTTATTTTTNAQPGPRQCRTRQTITPAPWLRISLFGSAHETGINMAFCDGSVHQIAYTIDSHIPAQLPPKNGQGYVPGQKQDPSQPIYYLGVHQRLANRCDGWSVDGSSF